jgi:hypothetical protein
MERSGIFLRLVIVLAVGGCGSQEPPPGNTGGAGGTGGTGGGNPTAGTGGSATGGSGGGGTGGTAGTGGSGGSGGGASGDYFPFALGNRWTYRVTESGGTTPPYPKENVIVRMEKVGGSGPSKDVMVYRVEARKKSSTDPNVLEDATISWQIRDGSRVIRYRETSCNRLTAVLANDAITDCQIDQEDYWTPARIRIDERPNGMAPSKGLKWNEMYSEYKNNYSWATTPPVITPTAPVAHTDEWTVLDVGVSATVPAGTFQDCLVLSKRTVMSGAVKTYTFCKGVGKVKEVGMGQTEELAAMPVLK